LEPGQIILRLKTRRDMISSTVLWEEGGFWREAPMHPCAFTPHYVYWQGELSRETPDPLPYLFCCRNHKGETFFLSDNGKPFYYDWSHDTPFAPLDWVKDAIFYQIFPDRFYNGNPANDPPGVKSWEEKPTIEGFFGGDLEGIWLKIPYLKFLGINALYLNPIFAAPSNHRYNTSDYFKIDPLLGNMGDFRRLMDSLHSSGIRIILDGVFNHTGTDFFAFKDILEKGEKIPLYRLVLYPQMPRKPGPFLLSVLVEYTQPAQTEGHQPRGEALSAVGGHLLDQGRGYRRLAPGHAQ